jgi:polyisoprenoid-binding protein YceI
MISKPALTAALAAVVLSAGFAFAATQTFKIVPTINDGASPNTMTVESETDFESFTGITNKVSGTITYDPATRSGSGVIVVDGSSIDTGNALRNTHMRSADWMNFERFPEIRFQTTSVKNTDADNFEVKGNLTMRGITKAITATARLRYSQAGFAQQTQQIKGNVIALSTRFQVKLSDFGVKAPGIEINRVNDSLTVSLRVLASDQ